MVIQRWQSVWLLIAAALAGFFCGMPMALVTSDALNPDSVTALMPVDVPGVLIPAILSAVLLLITIFLYRNLKQQKTMTLVSMLLLLATIVAEVVVVTLGDDSTGAKTEWMGSIFLLIGSLAFAFLAYRGIRHDENLLKAADRLR